MKSRQVISVAVAVLASVLILRIVSVDAVFAEASEVEADGPGLRQQDSSALVGRMHGVTMLKFRTDRALHEIRVVVNGKIAGSLTVAADDNQTTLKLAAVVSEQRKSVSIFMDTVNYGTEIVAAYPPIQDARDASPKEKFLPGEDVKLAEAAWIEVYRLSASRFMGEDVTRYELKVEIQ